MWGSLGRNARLPPGFKLEGQPKEGGTEQVRQIGGFMAPWSRKNLPRTLQVLGAGLQQIGDNRGQLSQFSANEAEQQARDMAIRAYEQRSMEAKQDRGMALEDRERELATEAAEQLRRTQALQLIPEEVRPFAELGIDGPITQYYRNRYPTPSRSRSAVSGAPALPPDFDWE